MLGTRRASAAAASTHDEKDDGGRPIEWRMRVCSCFSVTRTQTVPHVRESHGGSRHHNTQTLCITYTVHKLASLSCAADVGYIFDVSLCLLLVQTSGFGEMHGGYEPLCQPRTLFLRAAAVSRRLIDFQAFSVCALQPTHRQNSGEGERERYIHRIWKQYQSPSSLQHFFSLTRFTKS